jgi:hypothetical protein
MHKAVITLNTGLEDAETVTVAFLVAVGAAEQGRQTLIFLTKEAGAAGHRGFARAVAWQLPAAGRLWWAVRGKGRFPVCPDHAGLASTRPVRGQRAFTALAPMWGGRQRPSGDLSLHQALPPREEDFR